MLAFSNSLPTETVKPLIIQLKQGGTKFIAGEGLISLISTGLNPANPNRPHTINSDTTTDSAIDTSVAQAIAPDQDAHILDGPELPLPPDINIVGGNLKLAIFVSEYGLVEQIDILENSFDETYAQTVVEAFKTATFSPAIQNGQATRSQRIIEVSYDTTSA